MSILDQRELIFTHLHLTGALWDQPPRYSFEERVAALGRHGCGLGMGADELEALIAEHGAAWVRGVLAEHGVAVSELEVLFGWEAPEEFSAPARERFFRLAEEVGATKVKAAALAQPGMPPLPTDELTVRFGALCDRAADRGITVALESIAVIPGYTYAIAADAVIAADRPNGLLQLDMWHLLRDPTGLDAVARIGGDRIGGVELNDGPEVPAENLLEECVSGRLLPGEGALPVATVLSDVDEKGVDLPLSVEVLSAELRALTPEQNVVRTITAVQTFLKAAREAR